MDNEGNYAPQSPDLSGYQSYEQPDQFTMTYQPPQQSYSQSSYQQSSYYQQPLGSEHFDPFAPEPSSTQYPSQHQQLLPRMPKDSRMKPQDDDAFILEQPATKPGRKPKKPKVEEDICDKPAPGIEEGIDVKTKFPVARIKRIMQADEDVGKVSQVTPTAVSKALELFIISIVLKSSSVARSRSSKRVTAAHLKQAVQNDEQMDFLADIIAKVPDAPAPGSRAEGKKKSGAAEGDDSSDEAYAEGGGSKKRKGVGTGRRKRKSGSDD